MTYFAEYANGEGFEFEAHSDDEAIITATDCADAMLLKMVEMQEETDRIIYEFSTEASRKEQHL